MKDVFIKLRVRHSRVNIHSGQNIVPASNHLMKLARLSMQPQK